MYTAHQCGIKKKNSHLHTGKALNSNIIYIYNKMRKLLQLIKVCGTERHDIGGGSYVHLGFRIFLKTLHRPISPAFKRSGDEKSD